MQGHAVSHLSFKPYYSFLYFEVSVIVSAYTVDHICKTTDVLVGDSTTTTHSSAITFISEEYEDTEET